MVGNLLDKGLKMVLGVIAILKEIVDDLYKKGEETINRAPQHAKDLISSINAVMSFATEIREFMKKAKEALEKIEKSKLAKALNDDALIDKISNTVDNVNELINNLREDSLYQNTLKLIKDARELIEDIKKHPRKYFKIF